MIEQRRTHVHPAHVVDAEKGDEERVVGVPVDFGRTRTGCEEFLKVVHLGLEGTVG